MTPNMVDIEVRPQSLTPIERAKARDSFVRDFEHRFNDWSAIAKVCIEVERDYDWQLLGHPSWNAWLLDAAPRSRSYIYLVVRRYKELISDIPEAELAEIPLGSAGILKQVSSIVRRDPEIRKAAKSNKPSQLRETIRNHHPEQHIENLDVRDLRFTESQAKVFDEMVACHRALNNPATSVEEIIELLCAEYMNASWEDSGYSNRERALQLETAETR